MKPGGGTTNWTDITLAAVIVVLVGASVWQALRLHRGLPPGNVDEAVVETKADPGATGAPGTTPVVGDFTETVAQGPSPASHDTEDEARISLATEADLEAQRLELAR